MLLSCNALRLRMQKNLLLDNIGKQDYNIEQLNMN